MKPRLILYGKHHTKVGISKKENVSHLCCYDESFKSGYNFGTDIKEGLYILGYFAVSAGGCRRFEGNASLPSVYNSLPVDTS